MITTKYQGVPELVIPVQVEEGIWRAEASEPGDTYAIFSGVHGEETAGPEAVRRRVESGIKMVRGVLFLAHANLEAMNINQHQLDEDSNMNRMFLNITSDEIHAQNTGPLSSTNQRVQRLRPILDQSQGLLDLHEAHSGRIPPFIICEPNAFETALKIGAPVISFGWSKTEPGGTDAYMHEQGKEGLCYELGYIADFQENADRGVAAIDRFISAEGLSDEKLAPLFDTRAVRFIQALTALRRAKDGSGEIHFTEELKTFDPLTAGKLIATHGNTQIIPDEDNLVILFPNAAAKPGQEFLSFGKEVGVQAAMALAKAA
jgi:succinylglutamate desuccinylase